MLLAFAPDHLKETFRGGVDIMREAGGNVRHKPHLCHEGSTVRTVMGSANAPKASNRASTSSVRYVARSSCAWHDTGRSLCKSLQRDAVSHSLK